MSIQCIKSVNKTFCRYASTNILTIHGLFGQKNDLSRLGLYLKKQLKKRGMCDINTIPIPLPNHKDGPFTVGSDSESFAKALSETIDEQLQSKNLTKNKNIMIGHSLGGTVGYLESCLKKRKYEGVILLDITPPVIYYDASNEHFESKERPSNTRRNKIKEVLRLLSVTEKILKPIVYLNLTKYLNINKILNCFSVWQGFNKMEARYIMRAYEPKCVDNRCQLWNLNISVLRKYFHIGYMLGRNNSVYDGPLLVISCKNSGFASRSHLLRAKQKLNKMEIKEVDGGHWVLANKDQLEEISAICAEWINKISN